MQERENRKSNVAVNGFVQKISVLVVLLVTVCVLIGVIPAQAAVKWKFSTSDGKKKAEVNKKVTLEKQEFCDMNLYRNGKLIKDSDATYKVSWYTSDKNVVYVDKKTGKLRADKYGKMTTDTAQATITAFIKNKKSGDQTKQRFIVEVVSRSETPKPTATPTPQTGPSLDNVVLVPSASVVELGEQPATVYIEVCRFGYKDKLSLSFYSDDISIANAKWNTATEELDLIISSKKAGETTIHVYVVGSKSSTMDIKVISNGATKTSTVTPTTTPTPTPKPTAIPKPTATPIPTAVPTQSASSYSAKDSTGMLDMTVKPGFVSTITTRTQYAEEIEQAEVLLPDMEAWSEGKFLRSSITEYDTYRAYYFHSTELSNEEAKAMIQEYIALLEKYDIASEMIASYTKYSGMEEYQWFTLDYQGSTPIIENAVTAYDVPCDISVFYMKQISNELLFSLEHPKNIRFTDTGERYGGKKAEAENTEVLQKTLLPEYSITTRGLERFKISGWGWKSGDYLAIGLHPDLYEKGDVFTLEDFAAQADAGAAQLNSFSVVCWDIGRGTYTYENTFSPDKTNIDKFQSIRVEVIEKTAEVVVLQYAVKLRSELGDDYLLEGLCAVKTGNATVADTGTNNSGSSSLSVPSYTADKKCNYCNGGYVDCITCSGRGSYTCRVCNGSGSVSHYGYTVDCNCTNGKVTCSAFGCNGGKKKCTICGGDGVK